MISLSMLVVGILVGLMLYPMVEAIEDGTFFDWGDEDEHHERRWWEVLDTKKSVVAATENKNIKPNYYYITKIMKFIDTVEDRYRLIKDFYSLNKDDLNEEDKVKTRVMMNLLEMQLKQKQGA